MKAASFWRRVLCVAAILCLVAGCGGGGPPEVTLVEGVVLLNGKPLPSAQVELYPKQPGLGAEWISRGITDKDGRFQLTLDQQQKPGAAVGSHRVVVRDAPPPAEARSQSERGQEALNRYLGSLTNRPIPTAYTAVGTTTEEIDVKADQKQYEIRLTR